MFIHYSNRNYVVHIADIRLYIHLWNSIGNPLGNNHGELPYPVVI